MSHTRRRSASSLLSGPSAAALVAAIDSVLPRAADAACPTRNCAALPSTLPTRERASCPRAPLRPCPLALPASSLCPAVRCYCCHLRGPSCCMHCCCYLQLLLSTSAAAATAAASDLAAAPELLPLPELPARTQPAR
ncbi:unnamed protein product [Closterium sp. NIES-54]